MEKAIVYYEKALAISQEIDEQGKAKENNDSETSEDVYSDMGHVEKAIEYHEKALAISQEIGDKRGEGADLGNLGLAYSHT